eukprot:m51a1_g13825 putative general transcription factor ii h2 isoform 1 (394) ;mRNA; f:447160-448545
MAAEGEDAKPAWERGYKRSWVSDAESQERARARAAEDARIAAAGAMAERQRQPSAPVQRGVHRHLVLAVDFSTPALKKDVAPTRLACSVGIAVEFVRRFSDENPLSRIAIVTTSESDVRVVSHFGEGPEAHIKALRDAQSAPQATAGRASIHRVIDAACEILSSTPRHACRELLVLLNSITSNDPNETRSPADAAAALKAVRVRCSFVSLAGSMFLCESVAEATGGECSSALNERHARELVFAHIQAPARKVEEAHLIPTGFPERSEGPTFCACHKMARNGGYVCPRCRAVVCELPCTCPVCSLSLMRSSLLARSYRHLFPVPYFFEVKSNDQDPQQPRQYQCTACGGPICNKIWQCSACNGLFCPLCNSFVHESLHYCPSCLAPDLPVPKSQ